MVSQNSRKIKKPSKFNELVQQKSQKKVKVVENRNALVKEYKARNKTSKVEDRRFFGNRDMDMGQNQKFLGNIERGKKKKMAFFNLDSDDEDLNLTHKGVNLDELDDFKDHEIEKSISDDEGINAEMVDKMHFEGFDEEGDKDEEGFNQRRKSKQEIYKELIHKSKKAKFLRQQQQEENEIKIDELDDNFDTIASLLIRNPNQYKEQKQARGKEDAYQRLQNELAFDKRVKPESVNAQDPKLGRKKKLANQQDQEEESGPESELGIEEDKPAKKKEKKLQNELKAENKTKKFMSFLDDIRNLKNAKDKKDDDSDLNVDDSEEEGDEYDDEEGDEDDEEGEDFDDVDDDDDEDNE